MSTHTDKAYERDLNTLRERLLAMGAKVEGMIAESVLALAERDSNLGEHVIRGDVEVNQLELEIDDLCRRIIALRQPAASDLRLVTTALKTVTDLERVGDLSVNIAERAIDLNKAQALPIYGDLPRLPSSRSDSSPWRWRPSSKAMCSWRSRCSGVTSSWTRSSSSSSTSYCS